MPQSLTPTTAATLLFCGITRADTMSTLALHRTGFGSVVHGGRGADFRSENHG